MANPRDPYVACPLDVPVADALAPDPLALAPLLVATADPVRDPVAVPTY
jgi:hypothetical protein